MSLKIRGQEVTIRINIEDPAGAIVPQTGSFLKMKDFTATTRSDLAEEDYLGENETDIDFQHHGFDFTFTVDNQDARTLEYLSNIIDRERNQQRPPVITLTVLYTYREPGEGAAIEVYHDVFLRVNEQGFSGRKDNITTSFEGKAKRRTLLAA